MRELTHEEVSAALSVYAQGGVDAARGAEIEAHLEGCPDCRQELQGVMALTMAPSGLPSELSEPMSELERASLHREVRSALVAPAPSRSERWGRRFAPALGAAALLALIAVGIVSLDSEQGAQNATVDATTEEAPAQEEGASGSRGESFGGAADKAKNDPDLRTKDAAGGTGGGGTTTEAAAEPRPVAGAAMESSELSIQAGRDGTGVAIVRTSFARSALDPGDLVGARNAGRVAAYSNQNLLYSSAPSGRLRDTLRECVETTLSTSPFALTATAATFYPRDDILVVTFVWTEDSRALNYEMRGWRGGACDRPSPIYRRGRVP